MSNYNSGVFNLGDILPSFEDVSQMFSLSYISCSRVYLLGNMHFAGVVLITCASRVLFFVVFDAFVVFVAKTKNEYD